MNYECYSKTEKYIYTEEEKGNTIEITLKVTLNTDDINVQKYINRCKGKKCLASNAIISINEQIKSKNERGL